MKSAGDGFLVMEAMVAIHLTLLYNVEKKCATQKTMRDKKNRRYKKTGAK